MGHTHEEGLCPSDSVQLPRFIPLLARASRREDLAGSHPFPYMYRAVRLSLALGAHVEFAKRVKRERCKRILYALNESDISSAQLRRGIVILLNKTRAARTRDSAPLAIKREQRAYSLFGSEAFQDPQPYGEQAGGGGNEGDDAGQGRADYAARLKIISRSRPRDYWTLTRARDTFAARKHSGRCCEFRVCKSGNGRGNRCAIRYKRTIRVNRIGFMTVSANRVIETSGSVC